MGIANLSWNDHNGIPVSFDVWLLDPIARTGTMITFSEQSILFEDVSLLHAWQQF